MLKRTKGRLLITLLVITGLAGTLKHSSLTKQERKFTVNLMKDTKTEVLNSAKELSEAQLNFKSSPDSWSVLECIDHIALSENNLWQLIEVTMKAPANPEKRSEIKVADDQFVKMIEDRSNKVKTSEAFEPKNAKWKNINEALADFKNKRAAHIKYLKSSTEDLRNHVVQMPFGWIDCYQLSLMIAAHSNRHIQQIAEVKNDPNFPKQ